MPADPGPCTNVGTRWYHDPAEKTCKSFLYGGCLGNTNNFGSKMECMAKCEAVLCPNSVASVCPDVCRKSSSSSSCAMVPEALCIPDPCSCRPMYIDMDTLTEVQCSESKTLCQRLRLEKEKIRMLSMAHAQSVHIPTCLSDGSFNPSQCSDEHGVCWCVDVMGRKVDGSTMVVQGEMKDSMDGLSCDNTVVVAANITVIFDEDFDFVEKDISGFERAFAEAIAREMHVTLNDIHVLQVREGSVIVECTVYARGQNAVFFPSLITLLEDKITLGQFEFLYEGTVLKNVPTFNSTQIQVSSEPYEPGPSSGDGGSQGEHTGTATGSQTLILAVGISAGIVAAGVIVIGVLVGCCRKSRRSDDDTIRFENTSFGSPSVVEFDATIGSFAITGCAGLGDKGASSI